MESPRIFIEGFWPCTLQTFEVQTIHDDDGHIREEFDEDDLYIGPRSGHLLSSFQVEHNCKVKYFLDAQLEDGSDTPI